MGCQGFGVFEILGFRWACPKGANNLEATTASTNNSILPASTVRSGVSRNGRRMQEGLAPMSLNW